MIKEKNKTFLIQGLSKLLTDLGFNQIIKQKEVASSTETTSFACPKRQLKQIGNFSQTGNIDKPDFSSL
jgi:hypothetical protein